MTATTRPMRKRLVRREVPGGARFITFSCHRCLALLRHPRIVCVFVDCLAAIRARTGLSLLAYGVMPEHVHLLLTPGPGRGLAPASAAIKQRVATSDVGRSRERYGTDHPANMRAIFRPTPYQFTPP